MRKSRDFYTRNLFERESDLRIIRITTDDVLYHSDNFNLFSEQILKHEALYPDINKWLKAKVLAGIKDNSRIVYLGLDGDRPIVSAVLKLGVKAKICHLHIDQKDRDQHVGDLFFSMMALDAKRKFILPFLKVCGYQKRNSLSLLASKMRLKL